MTSHVHLIIGSNGDKMEDILRDFKRHTSVHLREAIRKNAQESRKEWMLWLMKKAGEGNNNNNDFQFWQQHNHPIELFDNTMMLQKLNYIHNNPVEAGFVVSPEEYLYSSARNYAGIKGLIEVMYIE